MVRYSSTNINELNEQPVNNQIKNFKDLFSKLPSELQKRIYSLKDIPQSPKWHPEGNTLKHTIMVVNRALKTAPGDIDLALAAMFHDIGKDATGGINPKTGAITHYGHEFTSAQLVKKYDSVINSLGGNVDDVFYIVNNHMRMKNYDIMRISKQREMDSHPAFPKLKHFTDKMDKGGLQDSIDELVNDMDTQLESFVFQDKNKEVLKEGGAYGHMNHPFDTEINLTFGQLKDIVIRALDGNLEVTKEKCIAGDSIISTENNGDITIAEFVDSDIDDTVLAYNEETNKTEYMEVMGKFNNDIDDDWLEIELEDGKVIHVTPNHKIYVEGIGYIRADELTDKMDLKII
jgi:putative nucleotidyltransferase with HDIG domain